MLEECSKYFNTDFNSISECQNAVILQLKSIENLKKNLIDVYEEIQTLTADFTFSEYIKKLEGKLHQYETQIDILENNVITQKNYRVSYCNRMVEWEKLYNKLPLYIRLFKFFPFIKRKIYNWVCINKNSEEIELFSGDLFLNEIQEKYRDKITLTDKQINEANKQMKIIEEEKEKINNDKAVILALNEKCINIINSFSQYNVDILRRNDEKEYTKRKQIILEGDVNKLNLLLDTTVRYIEFWLAVHYYECRWIQGEDLLTPKQRNTNIGNVMEKLYNRLAMVSPCMVMTFFMLPKQFKVYDNNNKKTYYMYNFIDLLIVDEAGQISPEIASASFSLAKKAVVVGDENQIPPVWGVNKALDISIALKHKVINSPNDFSILQESGLNSSQSSVMKVASYSCAYSKYDRGLFLCEHRRCYNEIVEYCNELIYKGLLQPLRGSGINSKNNPIKDLLPQMGYKEITVANSTKCGCSRCNEKEAKEIVDWLDKHYDAIVEKYQQADFNTKEQEILAIITPFTCQVTIIKKYLAHALKRYSKNVEVGTVHTFQGAERKVIILSTTYGSNDGCFFIYKNESLMNVAVSRAKDSFLIFGSRDCLCGSEKSASGLLKKHCNIQIN